jgi:peptidoglycan hydrolase-like protein with peptidoglycan-binding domain
MIADTSANLAESAVAGSDCRHASLARELVMSASMMRILLATFVLLSTGVAVNLLMMQPSRTGTPTLRLYAEHQPLKSAAEATARPAPPIADPALPAPSAKRGTTSGEARVAAIDPRQAPTQTPSTARAEPVAAGQSAGRELSFRDVTAAVQARLAARGYEAGQPDGVNGLVTRAAILAFEHDHGLAPTAEPSEALLRALEHGPGTISAAAYAAAARDKRPRAEQVVKTVQQSLVALGYAIAKPNGRLAEDTERAIREFEMDQRLPVTGRISGTIVARLARIAGHGKLTAGR